MPRPPACASISDVPTGVSFNNPNSAAAFTDNPGSIASPGILTSLPSHEKNIVSTIDTLNLYNSGHWVVTSEDPAKRSGDSILFTNLSFNIYEKSLVESLQKSPKKSSEP